MSTIIICSFEVGNRTYICNCRADEQTVCGRGCCPAYNRDIYVWNSWYFWLGLGLFAVFAIAVMISYLVAACRPQPVFRDHIHGTYGLREILGLRGSAVADVAALSSVTGPGGLIQPLVPLKMNPGCHSSDGVIMLEPLSPPYPIRPLQERNERQREDRLARDNLTLDDVV